MIVTLGTALALAVLWLVLPVGTGLAWLLTVLILTAAAVLVWLHTRGRRIAREQSANVLAALGAAATDLPLDLRARMPLVLVTGDGLPAMFNRGAQARLVHVGDGAIWVRADQPQRLPQLAAALRQWRDGRAPDGIVLAVAPDLQADAEVLAQKLRLIRQAASDASRLLGVKLPGYVAVYQRRVLVPLASLQWAGVSSAVPITGAERFEAVVQAAESNVQRSPEDRFCAARAATLASLADWTQQVIIGALQDRRQPARPWPLYGIGWIDCGPTSLSGGPWERDIELRTRVAPAPLTHSPLPWPLPQPLIEAIPRRPWVSPRLAAFAHAVALTACALAAATWGAAKNNEGLLARVGTDLAQYRAIPSTNDTARRNALATLVADRDQLERYVRTGVPLRLSFGMYRGAALVPALNAAIASYQPPPAPPAIVTLDSMSLFDSGRAQLKAGSNRALVGALEMIKAHPDKRILVAGHTDNVGDARSNLTLSTARAGAVRDWLVDASGIAATRFAIQGMGDTRPVADNGTPEGRARNRRVEITLIPDTAQP
ncbi:OmpA family protein [Ralstonia sp. 25C]|uniref:OmpA family protein n=1 Tax=Ralstonia sp. 25C TaxID=3447363 RepID=UPI003F750451